MHFFRSNAMTKKSTAGHCWGFYWWSDIGHGNSVLLTQPSPLVPLQSVQLESPVPCHMLSPFPVVHLTGQLWATAVWVLQTQLWYTHPTEIFTLSCQRKKQDEGIGAVCVSVCAGCVSVLICTASHGHVDVCEPYGCFCVYMLGTHAQPHYWQDLGTLSCSSLHTISSCHKRQQKTSQGFSYLVSCKQRIATVVWRVALADFSWWVPQQDTGENIFLGQP